MYDRGFLTEVLRQVHQACKVVMARFEPVASVDDFTQSATGMEKLDAICMQLIAIGESLKKIDSITVGRLLTRYAAIDWKNAKGLRDILSHHYFDVNAEAIYDVCQTKVPAMAESVRQMLQDIEKAE
jgi:uncharacterized protein with HEPN domain